MKPPYLSAPSLRRYLIAGDPFAPDSRDLIAETVTLPVFEHPAGKSLHGDGWRILTGNATHSQWARVAMRCEIEATEGNAIE